MTTHLKKVIEPMHNGNSKTVVWIIYGALGLILTLTFFSFNNANVAQCKTSELEVKAERNAINIQNLTSILKDIKENQKEMRDDQKYLIEKLNRHMEK